MPQANLTITIPEQVWIGDLSRSYPDAHLRILAALADDETGFGLVEITAPTPAELTADMRARSAVQELDVIQQYEETSLVQFETTMPLLLLPVQDSGVPLPMPFTIEDGQAEWDLTLPQDRLSALGEQLEAFGIPYTVNRVHQPVAPDQLLTETQLELLTAAAQAGYYDTPRETSLTQLATHLDIAKSTCSETLHRAEETVIKRFLADLDEPNVDTPDRRPGRTPGTTNGSN